MAEAMARTEMKWVCKCFGILGYFDCDRREFAEQDSIPLEVAKEHTNAVWNSEHKRRGPKWAGFREFEASVHSARARLYSTPELKPILDHVHAHFRPGKNKSIVGSFASHVYMFVMGKLLGSVQKKLESELGASIQGLAFDGLRVTKGHSEEALVQLAQSACEEVCPGIGAVWKVKPPTTEIKDAGEKKGSGCHLIVHLEEFENVNLDGDDYEGPPVEELTNAQLQSMHDLFRTPLGTVWGRQSKKPPVGVELDLDMLTDLTEALMTGKSKFQPQDMERLGIDKLEEGSYLKVDDSTYFVAGRTGYNYRWCKAVFERRYAQVDNVFVDRLNLVGDGDNVGVTVIHLTGKYRALKYMEVTDKGASEKPFPPRWLDDQDIAAYDAFCFVPPGSKISTKGKFNLFTPWAGLDHPAPDSDEAIECLIKIVNHLKCVIANNDPHQFRFIMYFFAQFLQYPQFKSIWPVLIGAQGTGKSTIMKLVRNMIGRNKFLSTSSPENNCWGKFNAIMLAKYFIEFSEMNKSNLHNQQEKAKQILEDDQFTVELKGVDAKVCESFHHGCVCTNSKTPVFEDRRWGPVRCSDKMAIPEVCSDCLAATDGHEHCAACTEKKTYHREMNELVEHPPAIHVATKFFLHAIDDCPQKLTRDYVVQSDQTDLIKEGSMDTIDYALRHIVKITLEEDPQKPTLFITPEELYQKYQAYVETFEKGDKGGADGYRSFTTKLGGKTINGLTKSRPREYNGQRYANPITVWKLDLKTMATEMKVDIKVPSVSQIAEAMARAEKPELPRNRKLPDVWVYRFEKTEEWIRMFVESNILEEDDEDDTVTETPTVDEPGSSTSQVGLVDSPPVEQAVEMVVEMTESKKRKQPLDEESKAKKRAVDPATGCRPCGCGPYGGCLECSF